MDNEAEGKEQQRNAIWLRLSWLAVLASVLTLADCKGSAAENCREHSRTVCPFCVLPH